MKIRIAVSAAALLAWGVGCGGGNASGPGGKTPAGGPPAAAISAAAAKKFDVGLEQLVAHDKAGDWSPETCTSVAQLFLDAAKEESSKTFNEAYYNAGLANQRCKSRAAEARALFKKVLDNDPKFHRAKVQLAMYAYADSGEKDLDTAISTIRDAAVVDAQFKNVEALVDLGMLYIKRNNKQEDQDGKTDLARAKRFIQSALALDDGYMPAFNQLAILYLEFAKEAAGRDTKRKMANSREKKVDTQALDLAAVVCAQAIKKNPKYASIHNTAGMIQVELGNLNGAVSEFNNARSIDPAFYEAQMNYAAVNLQFRGFDEATKAYRKAVELRPNDYDAHLGLALAIRGGITDSNFDASVAEASAELAKAKTIAPDRPETYYNEAILTQEFKAKSGKGASNEPELLNAKKLFGDFIAKAGSAPEFADAVKRSRDRMSEIDQVIEFAKQSEKDRKAAEADLKQKAAETEAKGAEDPGAAGTPAATPPPDDKK